MFERCALRLAPSRRGLLHGVATGFIALCAACGGKGGAQPPVAATPSAPMTSAEAEADAREDEMSPRRTDEACAAEPLCGLSGLCTAARDECVAGSDEDCRASKQCTTDGACSAVDEQCEARTDADCADADVCRRSGRCSAIEGICSRGNDAPAG